MEETFSIRFDGPAFEQHTISAVALAQSLLALDGLARLSAEAAYGKNAHVDIKVNADFKPGSFVMDMLIQHSTEIGAGEGAVTILAGVIGLGKWAFGKKIKSNSPADTLENTINVTNTAGQTAIIDRSVVTIYNLSRTPSLLSRLSQTLDTEGAESIQICNAQGTTIESITRSERPMFRQEEGLVLTDSEAEMLLEVIGPMLNGNPNGWRFGEGENGLEFFANVEDEDFLGKVKNNEYRFVCGTTILAVVRTVQRKNIRTKTDRTIVEVKAVYPPNA